jgi:hypothetical protein
LQFLAWLEADGLPRRNGDFRTRPGISPDTGFARPYIEDAKATQFNAFALTKRSLHALKDGLDRHLGLRLGYTRFAHDFINNIELDQDILPDLRR